MTRLDRIAFLISADGELTRELIEVLVRSGKHYQLPIAITLQQARARLRSISPAVIVLDESALGGEQLEPTVQEFSYFAPVVVLAAPARQGELAELIPLESAEFVAREGAYLPMVVALLERHVRRAEREQIGSETADPEVPHDFMESLRHEVNNPLTGILGNAEILLAQRERLPVAVVSRLETIVDLAVRLRETLRQLSCNWEGRRDRVRSA